MSRRTELWPPVPGYDRLAEAYIVAAQGSMAQAVDFERRARQIEQEAWSIPDFRAAHNLRAAAKRLRIEAGERNLLAAARLAKEEGFNITPILDRFYAKYGKPFNATEWTCSGGQLR